MHYFLARLAHVGRLARLVGLIGAVGVLLAGCGGGATAAPGTPAPSGIVAVEAKEYTFTPSSLTVPAGIVTFSVRNVGNEAHEFEVFKGEALVDEVEGLAPGLTLDLTVTLEAGEYTYICVLNGHDQLGMKGTLTVTGG